MISPVSGHVIGFEAINNTQVELVINGRGIVLDWYDLVRLENVVGNIRKTLEDRNEI
jgi:hypothetical protein